MNKTARLLLKLATAPAVGRMKFAAQFPGVAQETLLKRIVRANRATEYGVKHRFDRISDASGFRSSVPVVNFDDLSGYIEKMKTGAPDILTPGRPLMFCLTSGTTSAPKYVPLTRAGLACAGSVSAQWLGLALKSHPSFLNGSVLCMTGAPAEGRTVAGIPYGSVSGAINNMLPGVLKKSFVVPDIVSEIKNHQLRYYLTARLAMESDVSFVTTPNPLTLIVLAETGARYADEILRSIHDGGVHLPASIQLQDEDEALVYEKFRVLKPNPDRARQLRGLFNTNGTLVPRSYWNVKLIACWLGGSIGFQSGRLSESFSADTPLRDLGYLASEGSFSVPVSDNTPAGIPALFSNYYEFVPESEQETVNGPVRTLLCHELEEGCRYRIIITNWNGLYRYDIGDIVQVQGFYKKVPMIAFVRKDRDVLDITGEKLHVNHLVSAFRELNRRYGGIGLQFRFVPDYTALRYMILAHLQGDPDPGFIRSELLPFVDDFLCSVNIEYKSKRGSGRLNPPCMHVMDASWPDAVKKVELEDGKRDVQYKWRVTAQGLSDEDRKHTRSVITVEDLQ